MSITTIERGTGAHQLTGRRQCATASPAELLQQKATDDVLMQIPDHSRETIRTMVAMAEKGELNHDSALWALGIVYKYAEVAHV